MPTYLAAKIEKFTFRVADDRWYSREGLWVQPLDVAVGATLRLRVGVTDFLQQHSGDAAFVTVKPVGTKLAPGDELAELETIKVNLTLDAPVSGTVVAVNDVFALTPEALNQSPYEQGWLAELATTTWDADRAQLLDPQAYLSIMRAQAEAEVEKP